MDIFRNHFGSRTVAVRRSRPIQDISSTGASQPGGVCHSIHQFQQHRCFSTWWHVSLHPALSAAPVLLSLKNSDTQAKARAMSQACTDLTTMNKSSIRFPSWAARVTHGHTYRYTFTSKRTQREVTSYKFECCLVGKSETPASSSRHREVSLSQDEDDSDTSSVASGAGKALTDSSNPERGASQPAVGDSAEPFQKSTAKDAVIVIVDDVSQTATAGSASQPERSTARTPTRQQLPDESAEAR